MMNSAKVLLVVQYVFIIWQSSVYSASRSVQPASGCFFFVLAQPSAADHRCSSRPLRTPKRPTQPPLLAGRCASPMVGEEGEGSRRNTTYRCRFTRVAAVRPRVLRLPLVLWTDQHRPLMSDSISTNHLDLKRRWPNRLPMSHRCFSRKRNFGLRGKLIYVCQISIPVCRLICMASQTLSYPTVRRVSSTLSLPVAWQTKLLSCMVTEPFANRRVCLIQLLCFHRPSWPWVMLTQLLVKFPPLFLSQLHDNLS